MVIKIKLIIIVLNLYGTVVPAFAGLGAPHWDEKARGLIIGLTAFHTKHHIVRASLEAAAFQVKQVVFSLQ